MSSVHLDTEMSDYGLPEISLSSPQDCPLVHKSGFNEHEDWSDEDTVSSGGSDASDTSVDEEQLNSRLQPYWPQYARLFRSRGLHLDTVKAVKRLYGPAAPCRPYDSHTPTSCEEDLCPDPGLPDRLFRGTRQRDATRFVAKAVHPSSREYETISSLSRPPLSEDPANHTIPVLDLFLDDEGTIAFIVMEAWSTQIEHQPDLLCCQWQFLSALQQCIEHVAFMHKHHLAHLDLTLRNVLSNREGRFALIDFECTRRFTCSGRTALVSMCYGTEQPPEMEADGFIDPFKVDIWALGVLILRGSKLTGHFVAELMDLIDDMLAEDACKRPTACDALQTFTGVMSSLRNRLGEHCAEQATKSDKATSTSQQA